MSHHGHQFPTNVKSHLHSHSYYHRIVVALPSTLTSQPVMFFSDISITFAFRKNEVVIPLYSRVLT